MITPFTPEHYEVYIDDDTKRFEDIESLLDQKIDGKSLRLILPKVNVDIAWALTQPRGAIFIVWI